MHDELVNITVHTEKKENNHGYTSARITVVKSIDTFSIPSV